MWRVVVLTLLVAGGLGLGLFLVWAAGIRSGAAAAEHEYVTKGMLNPEKASLLRKAAIILSGLGVVSSIEDPEIISEQTRTKVNAWLAAYQREATKK